MGAATKQFIQEVMQHCPGEEEEKKARIAMVEEELKEGYILDYIVCFVKFLIPQTYL